MITVCHTAKYDFIIETRAIRTLELRICIYYIFLKKFYTSWHTNVWGYISLYNKLVLWSSRPRSHNRWVSHVLSPHYRKPADCGLVGVAGINHTKMYHLSFPLVYQVKSFEVKLTYILTTFIIKYLYCLEKIEKIIT